MSVGAPELLIEAESAAEAAIDSAAAEIEARSPLELFWRRFRADRVAVVSLGAILALILVAIIAPLIVTLVGAPGPNTQNTGALDQFGTPTGPSKNALWPFIVVLAGVVLAIAASALPGPRLRRRVRLALAVLAALLAIVLAAAFWPGAKHLFGVDPLGRDVFARVLYGARVSLLVAFVATGISMVVGVTLGMVAGYFRGAVDMAISRLIDVLLAFPILMLALGVAAACSLGHGCLGGVLKPGLVVVIFVIAFVNWTYIARIVRGQVLSLREKEFVEASRSLGASNLRIIFKEILPNLVAPIIVYATLIIPQNILFEAALSFLGAGVQPPTASWGAMLADATSSFNTAWWYMVFPGAALLITVLAFNLVGDGLQDALHPKAASS
ncbi:MAG: ABC transporter permease [Solirubrobacterales bacterium]|nr:ABC transporter permease [Solirubrobacterales bacterium]